MSVNYIDLKHHLCAFVSDLVLRDRVYEVLRTCLYIEVLSSKHVYHRQSTRAESRKLGEVPMLATQAMHGLTHASMTIMYDEISVDMLSCDFVYTAA